MLPQNPPSKCPFAKISMIPNMLIKREKRPQTWEMIGQIWEVSKSQRSTSPELGLIGEDGSLRPPLFYSKFFNRGPFGFFAAIGASSLNTISSTSRHLRTLKKNKRSFAELDQMVMQLSFDWQLEVLMHCDEMDQVNELKKRRENGEKLEAILGKTQSFEDYLIDEIKSPFFIMLGLAFVAHKKLRETSNVSMERILRILQNSIPFLNDWADQSGMVFESVRSSQAFTTLKTDRLYPRIELSDPSCYQITGEGTSQEFLQFTDKFVLDNKDLAIERTKDKQPYRISCGALRKLDGEISYIEDSVIWLSSIIKKFEGSLQNEVVDY